MSDFLGLPWLREVGERQDVRITLDGQPGEIWLPDSLFSVADAGWMAESSMPRRPLARWDAHELTTDITLVEPIVPVIYGGCYRRRKNRGYLPRCESVNRGGCDVHSIRFITVDEPAFKTVRHRPDSGCSSNCRDAVGSLP